MSRSHSWLLNWSRCGDQYVSSWRTVTAHTHRVHGHNRKHTHTHVIHLWSRYTHRYRILIPILDGDILILKPSKEEDIHLGRSFSRVLGCRLGSSCCRAAPAAHLAKCQSLMEASTPERVSPTPPPTQPIAPSKGRTRKPSAKVLEAQRSLRTPLITPRLTQNEPTASAADACEHEGTSLKGVASLITNLKKTITQQMSIIKAEQQSLKTQNAELQEEIRSLRAQLDTLSVSPSSTQTWASIAVSERPARLGTMISRTTDAGKADNWQLVINVSRVGEATREKVASTEAAKQAIQQGVDGIERLARAEIKDFHVWRANSSASVIKFSVKKNKKAAFWQTTAEWLELQISGARLVELKWYAVKAD
jgi:hypothetical protein